MERAVRYCTTQDGVSIAYWTLGEGPPLVYIPEPVLTASEAEDKLPATRHWHGRLANGRTMVRFDHRGTGLSHHNGDFSLDALCLDLAAVVDRLELSTFDLWGDMDGGIVAASYSARNPDRVAHLVLWNSWPRAADVPESETLQTLDRLIDLNWPLYAKTAATMDSGWNADEAIEYAGFIAAGCEPAVARAFVSATWEYDIEPILADISCPTLVLHRRDHEYFPVSLGRRLAAAIPNARLALIDGTSFYPWFEHADDILNLVDAFAPGAAEAPTAAEDRERRPAETSPGASMRVVLFTDVVGHTEMMQRLGDAAGRDVLREHERITRDALNKHGGTEIKTMGDGFLASFGSVTSAMDCAIALQRAISILQLPTSNLQIRIGLNAGEPIAEDGDLFGSTVIMASRIAAQANAGEILIPEPLRHLLSGKNYVYADRGETMLKGFEDAVRLYEVRWRE